MIKTSLSKRVLLGAMVGMVGLPSASWAESSFATGVTPSTQARLDFRVIIPRVLFLAVGSGALGTAVAANVPRARIDGTTLSYDGSYQVLSGEVAVRASVDVLNPVNELTGKRLPRRSANQWRLGADYAAGAWTLGGNLLKVGSSFDDSNNLTALSGYTTVDVYAAYQVNKDWAVRAKLNNLTDKIYETTLGYNQPRRGLFVTLNWQPK